MIVATATVYVPQAGWWTLGETQDDGAELDITSAAGFAFHDETFAISNERLVQVNFPTAGNYNFRYEFVESSGSAYAELFAAQGQLGNFASGGTNWRLVGDTFYPLQPAAPMLSVVRPLPLVQSITDAQTVADGTKAWTNSGYSQTVNFLNTGAGGNFANDNPAPGLSMNREVDDFVNESKTQITVTIAGTYTFGVGSDDGFELTITGGSPQVTFTSVVGGDPGNVGTNVMSFAGQRTPADTFGVITLPAGTYDLDLLYFQRTDGAEVELYAAYGNFTSWAAGGNNWVLVGDTAHGGLPVERASHRLGHHALQVDDLGGQHRHQPLEFCADRAEHPGLSGVDRSKRHADGELREHRQRWGLLGRRGLPRLEHHVGDR